MPVKLAPKVSEVVRKLPFLPAVSIVMPFNPKMSGGSVLENQITRIKKIVTSQVLENYNDDLGAIVLQRLIKAVKSLNGASPYQSAAIFVSPVFEKVIYFDFPVEMRVAVNEAFSIRRIVRAKKDMIRYLLLDLTSSPSKVYFGSAEGLSLIKINHVNEKDELAAFSKMDKELEVIMSSYSLPVFVVGDPQQLDYFQNYTGNANYVVRYIVSDGRAESDSHLFDIAKTYFNEWRSVETKFLHNQLMQAHHDGKLICGMKDVQQAALRQRPRRLIIKEDYLEGYRNVKTGWDETDAEHYYNRYSYVKNNLDQLIESVLAEGGDVDFVEDDTFEGYQNICMITQ
jgi:hypothetical protein